MDHLFDVPRRLVVRVVQVLTGLSGIAMVDQAHLVPQCGASQFTGKSCEEKRRKTETFSASAGRLAVGMPKACYPSSTQPGPEGVPSQIRAVDRPDSWSLGRLHPPLDAVIRE